MRDALNSLENEYQEHIEDAARLAEDYSDRLKHVNDVWLSKDNNPKSVFFDRERFVKAMILFQYAPQLSKSIYSHDLEKIKTYPNGFNEGYTYLKDCMQTHSFDLHSFSRFETEMKKYNRYFITWQFIGNSSLNKKPVKNKVVKSWLASLSDKTLWNMWLSHIHHNNMKIGFDEFKKNLLTMDVIHDHIMKNFIGDESSSYFDEKFWHRDADYSVIDLKQFGVRGKMQLLVVENRFDEKRFGR